MGNDYIRVHAISTYSHCCRTRCTIGWKTGWHQMSWYMFMLMILISNITGSQYLLFYLLKYMFSSVHNVSHGLYFSSKSVIINISVMIITGDTDRCVPLWNVRRLHRCMPSSSLEVIKKCGHLPHEERGDKFLAAVRRFLRQLSRSSEANIHGNHSYDWCFLIIQWFAIKI